MSLRTAVGAALSRIFALDCRFAVALADNFSYYLVMTLHVEDMYNFNSGAADIATGIPDAANGIFEITGLAKQYLNVSQISRTVKWTGRPSAVRFVTPASPRRERQPADNRRVRNRL